MAKCHPQQSQQSLAHEKEILITEVSFLDLATIGYAIFRLTGALKIHGSVGTGSERPRAGFCACLLLKHSDSRKQRRPVKLGPAAVRPGS